MSYKRAILVIKNIIVKDHADNHVFVFGSFAQQHSIQGPLSVRIWDHCRSDVDIVVCLNSRMLNTNDPKLLYWTRQIQHIFLRSLNLDCISAFQHPARIDRYLNIAKISVHDGTRKLLDIVLAFQGAPEYLRKRPSTVDPDGIPYMSFDDCHRLNIIRLKKATVNNTPNPRYQELVHLGEEVLKQGFHRSNAVNPLFVSQNIKGDMALVPPPFAPYV